MAGKHRQTESMSSDQVLQQDVEVGIETSFSTAFCNRAKMQLQEGSSFRVINETKTAKVVEIPISEGVKMAVELPKIVLK